MKGSFYNTETGKWVSGAAAQQMVIKLDGGWDEHHQKFAEAIANSVAKEVTHSYLNQLEQTLRHQPIVRVK